MGIAIVGHGNNGPDAAAVSIRVQVDVLAILAFGRAGIRHQIDPVITSNFGVLHLGSHVDLALHVRLGIHIHPKCLTAGVSVGVDV